MSKLSTIFWIIIISIFFAAFSYFFSVVQDIPDHKKLAVYKKKSLSNYYDQEFNKIGSYNKSGRVYVPIDKIPKQLIDAFVIAEDRSFYEHGGVDARGILRAIFTNIKIVLGLDKGGYQGGSTITQQLAKNLFLNNDRKLKRKIREAILAYRLTKTFSKEQILEIYLNIIYLGSNNYGIADAAEDYFAKELNELTIAESAMLAALPKAPSRYNPRADMQKATFRRNVVLNSMYSLGYINKQEWKHAKDEAIKLKPEENLSSLNFFNDEVKQKLGSVIPSKILENNNLTIQTTFSKKVHALAFKAFEDGILSYSKKQGYVGAIERIENLRDWQNKLQDIVKYSSVPNDFIDRYKIEHAVILFVGEDYINTGTVSGDVYRVDFSTMEWSKNHYRTTAFLTEDGSLKTAKNRDIKDIFKMGDVILLSKKNDSYQLIQMPKVNGAIVVMNPQNGYILSLIGGFSYDDSQYNRATKTIRNIGTLTESLDILTLLSQKSDVKKRLNLISSEKDTDNDEYDLLTLINAYAVIANGGKKISPVFIEKISDENGEIIFKNKNSYKRVFSELIIFKIISMFSKNVTQTNNTEILRYAKVEGETKNNFASWYIGFTPEIIVGIYLGFDNPDNLGSEGKVVVEEMFLQFFKEMQKIK